LPGNRCDSFDSDGHCHVAVEPRTEAPAPPTRRVREEARHRAPVGGPRPEEGRVMTRAECQRYRELMDDWLNSELSVETTQEILRHVERCADCRSEIERRQAVRRLLQRRLTPSVPPTLRGRVVQALMVLPDPEIESPESSASRLFSGLRWKRRST